MLCNRFLLILIKTCSQYQYLEHMKTSWGESLFCAYDFQEWPKTCETQENTGCLSIKKTLFRFYLNTRSIYTQEIDIGKGASSRYKASATSSMWMQSKEHQFIHIKEGAHALYPLLVPLPIVAVCP